MGADASRHPGRRRSARRPEGGQATAEWAGLLFLVAVLVAALVPLVVPIGPAVVAKICQALGVSCGSPSTAADRAAALSIPCVLGRDDRTLGYNVNVEFLRIDRKDGDQLSVNGNGGATVLITQGGGIGAEAAKELGAAGGFTPSASAKITANGDLGYVYNLPKDYGGAPAAQALLDNHRDGTGQAVDIVLPFAETAQEGLTRIGHSIRDGWNWAWSELSGDEPTPAEIEARRRADAAGTADAVQVSLSLQAEGKLAAANELVKGTGSISGEVRGTAQIALNGSGPDKASSSFSGTALFDLKGDLNLGVPGRPSLPPLFNPAYAYGRTVSYQVVFGDHGEPVRFVLTTEERSTAQLGLAPGATVGKGKVNGGAKANGGTLDMHTLTLDLADPANRAAFDQVFYTRTASLDGHVLGVAGPRIAGLDAISRSWDQLQQRLASDAYAVDYRYDLAGDTLSAGAGRDALKAGGWGVGGEKTHSSRALVSAVASDHRTGLGPVPLATCGGG